MKSQTITPHTETENSTITDVNTQQTNSLDFADFNTPHTENSASTEVNTPHTENISYTDFNTPITKNLDSAEFNTSHTQNVTDLDTFSSFTTDKTFTFAQFETTNKEIDISSQTTNENTFSDIATLSKQTNENEDVMVSSISSLTIIEESDLTDISTTKNLNLPADNDFVDFSSFSSKTTDFVDFPPPSKQPEFDFLSPSKHKNLSYNDNEISSFLKSDGNSDSSTDVPTLITTRPKSGDFTSSFNLIENLAPLSSMTNENMECDDLSQSCNLTEIDNSAASWLTNFSDDKSDWLDSSSSNLRKPIKLIYSSPGNKGLELICGGSCYQILYFLFYFTNIKS